eukprot:4453802-Amphidinium_carterae.1
MATGCMGAATTGNVACAYLPWIMTSSTSFPSKLRLIVKARGNDASFERTAVVLWAVHMH